MTRVTVFPRPDARMTAGRKAAIVDAIDRGALPVADAQARYQLSAEELDSWRRRLRAHGPQGLAQYKLQALPLPAADRRREVRP